MQRGGVRAGTAAFETWIAGDHATGAEVDMLAAKPLLGEGPGLVVDDAAQQRHFGGREFGEGGAAGGRVVLYFIPRWQDAALGLLHCF